MSRTISNYDTSTEDPFAGLPVGAPETIPSIIRPVRGNRYGGRCGLCKVWIDPEKGRLESVAGRWVTYCVGECPVALPVAPLDPITEGMYRTPEGVIYKVQVAHHGSGNLYVKRMFVIEGWEFETHGKRKATFEFERGAIRKLTSDMKMTLEQAKEFGALYGMCCVCGAILTDETSIANGIGPICGSKGW